MQHPLRRTTSQTPCPGTTSASSQTPSPGQTPAQSSYQASASRQAPGTAVGRASGRVLGLLPGLALAAAATVLAWLVAAVAPILSPLLVAIVLGVVVGNVLPRLPESVGPGLDFAAKPLLRLGVVALGAQVLLGDILDLGWLVLVLAAVIVAVGILSSLACARLFGVDSGLALLIGCGFGICGAAAVAGVESTCRARKEDVAAAIGLVVLFGTLMIALIPGLNAALGLPEATAGMWAGASTHEVAQVVAIGGILGPAALQVAVLVKLSRVLMLAPTVALLALVMRRADARTRDTAARAEATDPTAARAEASDPADTATPAEAGPGDSSQASAQPPAHGAARPPIVPLFVVGFLVMAGLRTMGVLPEAAITGLGWIQTVCLSMAMFALGRGVRWQALRHLGAGPLGLAALVTITVTLLGLGGALLLN